MEAPLMNNNSDGNNSDSRPAWERHVFMCIVSAIIVITVVYVSYKYSKDIYKAETTGFESLIPFSTCLAGVLLFIMGVSRRKRTHWAFRDYWGDYCYRIAQAFAYLFIVLWAWARADTQIKGTNIPPNILGFLVGFFILRVERAMESLGEKFEEVLMSILPRSVTYVTIQERRRQQLRDTYKLEDVATQYEALRPIIEDEAVRETIDQKMAGATEAAGGENPEDTKKRISEVLRLFEDARQAMNESVVPLEDLLSPRKD